MPISSFIHNLRLATFLVLASSACFAQAGALKNTQTLSLAPTPCIKEANSTPDGKFTYAASHCEAKIFIYSRNSVTGELTEIDSQVGNPDTGEGLSYVQALVVSPNGKFVFAYGVTGKPGDQANPYRGVVQVFQVNSETGLLTFKFEYIGSGKKLLLSPDGNYLYLLDTKLEVLRVAGNGQLSNVQTLTPVESNGNEFALSPDASHLYIAASRPNRQITILDRNNTTGSFSNQRDLIVPGLRVEAPTISPDGKSLYVFADSQLNQFSIDESGDLTQISAILSPPNFVAAKFYCPTNMLISPNGKLLYFIDSCGENMQTWLRDTSTGALSFLGFNDGDDLDIPNSAFQQTERLAFSPDNYFAVSSYIYGITTMELTADIVVISDVPATVEPQKPYIASFEISNNGGAVAHEIDVILTGSALSGATSVKVSHPLGKCQLQGLNYHCTIPELVADAAEVITLNLVAPSNFSEPLSLAIDKTQAEIDRNETYDKQSFAIAKTVGSSVNVSSSSLQSSSSSMVSSESSYAISVSSTMSVASSSSAVNTSQPAEKKLSGGSFNLGFLLALIGLLGLRRFKNKNS